MTHIHAQPMTELMSGMGIGLPISRLYARHWGGDIRVISVQGCELLALGDFVISRAYACRFVCGCVWILINHGRHSSAIKTKQGAPTWPST